MSSIPEGTVELRSDSRWYRIDITVDPAMRSMRWYDVITSWGPLERGVPQPQQGTSTVYNGTRPENVAQSVADIVDRKIEEGFAIHSRELR